MLMKTIITLVFCTMLISCNKNNNVKIVTTIKPIQMLVTAIAADDLQSTQLIPDNASPHHYALKPSDIKKLQHARLIFRIDEGLESFLNKPLEQAKKNIPVIPLAEQEGIHLIPFDKSSEHNHSGHHHSHDLHIWLDPNNAIAMSKVIAKQLSQIDPSHAQNYAERLQQLISKIEAEDKKLQAALKPIANKPMMVFHNAWGYFENHYGLNNVSVINQSTSAQLGIAKIQAIREIIKTKKIACLFSEPQAQQTIIQTLIKDSDVKASELNIIGQNIAMNSDSYIKLLDSIAESFLQCGNVSD